MALVARTVIKNGVRGVGLHCCDDLRPESLRNPNLYPVFVPVDWTSPTTIRVRLLPTGDAQIVELNNVPLFPAPTLPRTGLEQLRTTAEPSIEIGTGFNAIASTTTTLLMAEPSPPAPFVLTVDPVTGIYGDTATLRARLTNADGTPVSGRMLNFALFATAIGSAVTDADGVATLPGFHLGLPMLNAGSYQRVLRVSFDAGGAVGVIVASANLEIARATPVITWPAPAPLTVGTPLSATQLNATADVDGFFTYSPPAGTVLMVGNGQTLTTSFVANDSINYQPLTASALIDVVPAVGLGVTVTSPNSGERVVIGTPTMIQWTAFGQPTVFDAALSRDGGASYAAVPGCTGLPGTARQCAWTPTGPVTFNARVRIITRSATTTSADLSDAAFAVVFDNAAPVLDPLPDRTLLERTVIYVDPVVHDTPGDTLTFSLVGPVPIGVYVSGSGTISFEPSTDQAPGTYPVTLRVTDSGGLYDQKSFTFTVRRIDPSVPGRLLMDTNNVFGMFTREGQLQVFQTPTVATIQDFAGAAGTLYATYPAATGSTDLLVTFDVSTFTAIGADAGLNFVINSGYSGGRALVARTVIKNGQLGIGLTTDDFAFDDERDYPVFVPVNWQTDTTLRLRLTADGSAQIVELNNVPLIPVPTLSTGSHLPVRSAPSVEIQTGGLPEVTADILLLMVEPSPPDLVINAATGVTRRQGSPTSNSQIAAVLNAESGATVTITSANPSNGVSVSHIVNTNGSVTADIVADCTATNASFTLTATDGNSRTATATLDIAVTANTASTLAYASPQTVTEGNSLTINPATGPSDNGNVSSIVVQSHGTYTGGISVNSAGVVSTSNAAPVGSHTITIRATDNCGAVTDATFTLNINANTLAGNNVTFRSGEATVRFPRVTTPGHTTVTPIDPNQARQVPNGYTLCSGCPAYDISTTATYVPPVEVCINVPASVDQLIFANLKLLHGENGELRDRTAGHVTDPQSGIRSVCGSVDSLSPFVLASAPAPTPTQARIVFESLRNGNLDIYSMNADGSNQTRLTTNAAADANPAGSPDHSRIAFTSTRDGNLEVYVMNADGSNQTRLTNNSAIDDDPAWSPDGSRIVFWSARNGNPEIYVMNANGTNPTRLTNNPALDIQPEWSPDGSKIVFTSNRDGLFNTEIYVMNANGSGVARLTRDRALDGSPDWSPDGTKIVFASNRTGLLDFEIWVMNADGANPVRLTTGPRASVRPSWSPDGSKIVFARNRDNLFNFEIYSMNANGSNPSRLTSNTVQDFAPNW